MKINEQKVTIDQIKNFIDIAVNKQDMNVSLFDYLCFFLQNEFKEGLGKLEDKEKEL